MKKCPYCGGQIVMEFIGSYGLIYGVKTNGEPSKKLLRRRYYGSDGDEPMIYCWDCRKPVENCG